VEFHCCVFGISALALMETESPELKNVVFAAVKKRPQEAIFRAWKNTFLSEDL